MERRAAVARTAMEERGLDAVIATSYAASYYLSGAPIHCFGRPLATLLPRAGEPAMVTSIIEKEHVAAQSWIDDVRHYWDYGTTSASARPQPPLRSLAQLLAGVVADRGLS